LASNPRLVKEAQALAANGYTVHLIFTQYVDYLVDFDYEILHNNPSWTYNYLNRTAKNKQAKLQNFIVAAIQKVCIKLLLAGKKSNFILAHAINRYFLWQFKKAVAAKADLYIAHNLAALPVAVWAAKKNLVKCGFDAEDFHRHETTDDINDPDVMLKTFVEENYIPQTNYLTASSLPISECYQKLFPLKKFVTVLNVFPIAKEVQPPVTKKNEPLKLFWFSQTIGLNRGLQDAFYALKVLESEQIELHLLGSLTDKTSFFIDKVIADLQFKKKPAIFFYNQINPDQIPVFAAHFDVGLALEPGFCLNNNIAHTNKVFTYLQSGLALVLSDTVAQKQFILENPALGFCYEKGNVQQLAAILKRFIDEPDLLQKVKLAAYQSARTHFNWETESVKFLETVKKTLDF
jgi:glycosyltransferase involved in cell wall biosynthesis